MTEDESDRPRGNDSKSMIQYDYFKYLTSLCIFSLGGVLALADKVPSAGRGKELMIAALLVICVAALLAFTGVGEMVRAEAEGDGPRKSALKWSSASPLILSVGLGMFVYLFARSLLR